MAVYELQTPFDPAEIAKLRVGDLVYVSGKAFTCRSRLHRWVFDENHPSPKAAMERDLLIHVGPIVLRHPDSYELVSGRGGKAGDRKIPWTGYGICRSDRPVS